MGIWQSRINTQQSILPTRAPTVQDATDAHEYNTHTVHSVDALRQLAGTQHIPADSSFWRTGLATLEDELDGIDARLVASMVEQTCVDIVRNTPTSGNLLSMVNVVTESLISLSIDGYDNLTSIPTWIINLVFLLRVILNFIIANVDDETEEQIYQKFNVLTTFTYEDANVYANSDIQQHSDDRGNVYHNGNAVDITTPVLPNRAPSFKRMQYSKHISVHDIHQTLAYKLVNSIVATIIDLDIREQTVELHLELVNTLLTLCSTQMYHQIDTSPDANKYTQHDVYAHMINIHPRLGELLVRLLHYVTHPQFGYCGNPASASNVQDTSDKILPLKLLSSALYGVSSVLWLPLTVIEYFFPSNINETPLSNRAALLFLQLVHQPHSNAVYALNALRDDHASTELSSHSSMSLPAVSYVSLYNTITAGLTQRLNNKDINNIPSYATQQYMVLLLYTMLQHNNAFYHYVLSKTNIDDLLLPLLHALYHHAPVSANATYMILIILLMLSQDGMLASSLFSSSTCIPRVDWFKESTLNDISIGSLCMTVLLRTVQQNLQMERDVYLHNNCLAVLSNLSSKCVSLHHYPSHRIIVLLETLIKRYNRMLQSSDDDSGNDEIQLFAEYVYNVLDMTLSALTGRSSIDTVYDSTNNQFIVSGIDTMQNFQLLYWLMHGRQLLDTLSQYQYFTPIMAILNQILYYMDGAIIRAQLPDRDIENVLSTIGSAAKQLRTQQAAAVQQPASAAKYTYQEQDASYVFFLPYAHQLIYQLELIPIYAENICSFDSSQFRRQNYPTNAAHDDNADYDILALSRGGSRIQSRGGSVENSVRQPTRSLATTHEESTQQGEDLV